MERLNGAERQYLRALSALSGLCLLLFVVRLVVTHTSRFMFIPENLALTWIGLFFGWFLVNQLKSYRWHSWHNIIISVLWVSFLPNCWYVLTDFLHVFPTGEVSELYDIVLISSLVIVGFINGFTSLLLVHKQIVKHVGEYKSLYAVGAVLLLASFAIYLGRVLRWNSWDVIADPGGLILNVSDRIIDPLGHPRALNVTGLFFLLLSTTYYAIWSLLKPITRKRTK